MKQRPVRAKVHDYAAKQGWRRAGPVIPFARAYGESERRNDMSKLLRVMALALIAMLFSSAAAGQGFDLRRLFFGAGMSQNIVSGLDNSTGFQVFAGYNFPPIPRNFYVDPQAAYMATGNLQTPRSPGPFSHPQPRVPPP